MSTRYLRTATTERKATNERDMKILKALLQEPGNKHCADCKRKDPRWASWNLGIFVCIRCSGIHRSLGVHISKVKSVDLDTWLPDQVESMKKWGNERANKYWGLKTDEIDRDRSEHRMESFIRAKYDEKRYAPKGPIPDPSTLGDSGIVEQKKEPVAEKQAQKPSSPAKSAQQDLLSLDFGSSSSAPATPASKPAPKPEIFDIFSEPPATARSANSTPPPQPDKHQDFMSSIMSLYNTPSAPTQTQPPQTYLNNKSSFQQQLSGLSLGKPSSGIIPQAPTAFQNNQDAFQPSSFSAPTTEKKPQYDAFADLLK